MITAVIHFLEHKERIEEMATLSTEEQQKKIQDLDQELEEYEENIDDLLTKLEQQGEPQDEYERMKFERRENHLDYLNVRMAVRLVPYYQMANSFSEAIELLQRKARGEVAENHNAQSILDSFKDAMEKAPTLEW